MSKLNNSNRDRHLVGFVPPLGHDVDAGGVVRGEGDCLEMALVLLITSTQLVICRQNCVHSCEALVCPVHNLQYI